MPSYTYNHTQADISRLISELNKHNIEYSEDAVVRDSKANTPHSPASAQETPLVVLFPTSTVQTSIILKACNERRIAVTSVSGGTSFGGALSCVRGGVCVSFERMDKVVRVNVEDMDVVVQPGVGWMDLNEQIKHTGLFFPVDPAPGARIGGMVCLFSPCLPLSLPIFTTEHSLAANHPLDRNVLLRHKRLPLRYHGL
jgi:D-lactate dehydrogenase (cytochrome)